MRAQLLREIGTIQQLLGRIVSEVGEMGSEPDAYPSPNVVNELVEVNEVVGRIGTLLGWEDFEMGGER